MSADNATETVIIEDGAARKGCLPKACALGGILLSAIFLLNLTFGVVEIPDNMPFVGNLDEVVVTGFLLACLRYLGLDVLPFGGKSDRKSTG